MRPDVLGDTDRPKDKYSLPDNDELGSGNSRGCYMSGAAKENARIAAVIQG